MAVQDQPRRDNRFFMWAGHYSIRMMIPAVALIVVFDLAGHPGGDNGVLSWVVTGVWFAWFATMMIDMNYHESRLCERCITVTPLDPQKAVARWDRVLRLFHSKRTLILITVGIISWFFIGPQVQHHQWWGNVIDVLSLALIAVIVGTMHIHRRLYPWCPYCRWGDGGEPEIVPDPAPAESVS